MSRSVETITREQAAQIVGNEKSLNRLLLNSFSDELARLCTGAKLIARHRLGETPAFQIVSNGDGSDIVETMEALRRGESELLSGSKHAQYRGHICNYGR